jgi:transcriptional regulator with XRE-family HTH domain
MQKRLSDLDKHIGLRLRMRRILLNLSQDDLAQKLNITFQQVQKYEKATNRISATRLYEMAQVLNIDISYFFEGYHNNIIKENINTFDHVRKISILTYSKKIGRKKALEF